MAPESLLDVSTLRYDSDAALLARMRALVELLNTVTHALVACVREAESRRWAKKRGERLPTLLRILGVAPAVAARIVYLATRIESIPKAARDFGDGRLSLEHTEAVARGLDVITSRAVEPVSEPERATRELSLLAQAISGATPREIRDKAREISNSRDSDTGAGGVPVAEDTTLNSLEITSDDLGRVIMRADLDVVAGAQLGSAIDALIRPRAEINGLPEPRSKSRLRADALALLVHRAGESAGGLPRRAQMLVTVSADRPDTSRLSWMGPITARLASRIACDADIAVAGLDGSGVPLTLGRRQRLFTDHQRTALLARDGGCIKCGDQGSWVHAHHVEYWSRGGETNVSSGAILCPPCHVDVHDNGWEIVMGIDGHPWLRPPASIDPHRELIRSHHRRTMTLDQVA